MNEAYEVQLNDLTASFLPSPFDLVIGVERLNTVVVEAGENTTGFTDIEWQVMWSRVRVGDTLMFLTQNLYDELDGEYGDIIGEKLWELTQTLN